MRKLLFGAFLAMFAAVLRAQTVVETVDVGDTVTFASDADDIIASAPDSLAPSDSLLPWAGRVRARLDAAVADRMFTTSQLGLCVYDLTADSLIYDYNMRQTMRPASTEKLLTGITALDLLGGAYRFETTLYVEGAVEDSVLRGNVYIKGGMDPAFGHDDMRAFSNALVERGIFRIDGEVYADVSFKDTVKWGSGWCWDDESASLTPLLYNGGDGFMQKFFEALYNDSIKSRGTYSFKEVPQTADVFSLVSRFHSIDQVLMPVMKESDNMFAEALFYQLGAGKRNEYATAERAAAQVKALINSIGLDASQFRIVDGSGLSLYNYASPQLLMRMLCYAHSHTHIFSHLYPALPIAAMDGTLARRMRGTSADGNIHAKTGTVEGVSTLAGYATSPENHLLAFAIMNQGVMRARPARNFQDKVCRILTEP